MIIVSPSLIKSAARDAIEFLSSLFVLILSIILGCLEGIAPPCVRTRKPSASSDAKSDRVVTTVTPSLFDKSLTLAF